MENNNPLLNNNFITIGSLCVLLHKSHTFKNVLIPYIEANYLNEKHSFQMPDGSVKDLPIFYYGHKKGGIRSLFVYKNALPRFFKKHEEELYQLGISKAEMSDLSARIKTPNQEQQPSVSNKVLELKELPSANLPSRYITIWNLASKFSCNSVIVAQIADYIRENLLFETFEKTNTETGEIKEENMFLFVKKSQRKMLVLKTEALNSFLSKHQERLNSLALQFEKKNDFISLRNFSRYLGNPALEPKLKAFILEHMDDTFEQKNAAGITTKVPFFEYLTTKNLTKRLVMHKRGVTLFIQKYLQELIDMGFKFVKNLAEKDTQKIGYKKNILSLKQLAQKLGKSTHFAKTLYEMIENENAQRDKKNASTKLFLKRFHMGTVHYFIQKKDFSLFVQQYADKLKTLGVEQEIVDGLLAQKSQDFFKKTEDMISLSDFTYTILGRNNSAIKQLITEIKENHLNDTYTDEKTQTQQPIFSKIYDLRRKIMFHVFTSADTMRAFISKEKEMFIRHGIKADFIRHILSQKETLPYQKGYLFIADMVRKFGRCGKRGLASVIKENYLSEQITDRDKNGNEIKRDMFVYMQKPSSKFAGYALSENDFRIFIRRHGQEIGLSPLMMYKLSEQEKTPILTDDYINMSEFSMLLKNKRISKELTFLVENNFIHERVTIHTTSGTQKEPYFVVANRPNGSTVYYFDMRHLQSFLINHFTELTALNVQAKNISALLIQHQKDKRFYLPIVTKFKNNLNMSYKKHKLKKSSENQR